MGEYRKHLRQVRDESNQSYQSNLANQSDNFYIESDGSYTYTVTTTNVSDNNNYQHICPRNPLRQCNCSDSCADDDNGVDGNKRCPTSGRICNTRDCPDECLDTERKNNYGGGPCVVVGDYTETSVKSVQSIYGTGVQSADSKGDADSKPSNDGLTGNPTT
jgi:hypothetical protein